MTRMPEDHEQPTCGDDEPDPQVVEAYRAMGALQPGDMPVATLTLLWGIDAEGHERLWSKFNGRQQISVTIGDLHLVAHRLMHELEGGHDDDDG